jgi:hypothetical protein
MVVQNAGIVPKLVSLILGCEKGRAGSGPIGLGFLANPNPYGPARVKPENPTEFSDAKNPYTIPN